MSVSRQTQNTGFGWKIYNSIILDTDISMDIYGAFESSPAISLYDNEIERQRSKYKVTQFSFNNILLKYSFASLTGVSNVTTSNSTAYNFGEKKL